MQFSGMDPRKEYLRQSVLSASPAELIAMLFDGCIKNCRMAELCYEERKDIEGTNAHLLQAQRIISELVNSLDMSMELSSDLLELYQFLLNTLREINVSKDMSRLPPVIEILESMRDTWRGVAKEQRKNVMVEECR